MRQRKSLLAVLVWTMTATSFQIFALAVLAVELIADLGLTRTELGLLGAVNTLVGALSAPFSGRLTDRIGPWAAVVLGLSIASIGMTVMALSPNVLVLALSAVISGIPQGWGNPATNALIAERVAAGEHGVITGIKQSGVQLGVFLSGLTLPTLALLFGWRGAVAVFAAAFGLGAVVTAVVLPRRSALSPVAASAAPSTNAVPSTSTVPSEGEVPPGSGDAAMDPWIWRLAGFALLSGTLGGAISRFFPLWAEEAIGLSTQQAGLLVAAGGLLGIPARIWAGRVAESRIAPDRFLMILATIGGLYGFTLLVTPQVGSWLLWPATVLNSVGIGAWNAVAMLAIIMVVPRQLAGRASGIVMLGFLGGLSIGSPMAGWIVDRFDSYSLVWTVCMVLSALAVLSLRGRRPERDLAAEAVTAAG